MLNSAAREELTREHTELQGNLGNLEKLLDDLEENGMPLETMEPLQKSWTRMFHYKEALAIVLNNEKG